MRARYRDLSAALEKKASRAYTEGFNEGAARTAEQNWKAAEKLDQVEQVIRGHDTARLFGPLPEPAAEISPAPRRGLLARLIHRRKKVASGGRG